MTTGTPVTPAPRRNYLAWGIAALAVLVFGFFALAIGVSLVRTRFVAQAQAAPAEVFEAPVAEAPAAVGLTAEEMRAEINKAVAEAVAGIQIPEAPAAVGLTAEEMRAEINKAAAEAVAGIQIPEAPAAQIESQAPDPVDENPNPGVALNAFDPGTYAVVPVGGLVDLTNPYAMPEGFPADWENMTPRAQADWVASVVGGPVEVVLEEPDVAFAFNGKGITTHSYTCPAGFTCHQHLVDGDRTVLYRGHGELAEVYATTFRIEGLIPGGGGLCQNWHDALVYELSIGNIVHGLGEVSQCPALPADRVDDINPALGVRLAEVKELSGADVISIGTVAKGFGAFWVYSNGLGIQDLTCPAGFRCLYTADGETWTWAEGPSEITGAQGAILFDVAVVADPEKVAAGLIE